MTKINSDKFGVWILHQKKCHTKGQIREGGPIYYQWSYKTYKWPYDLITGVISYNLYITYKTTTPSVSLLGTEGSGFCLQKRCAVSRLEVKPTLKKRYSPGSFDDINPYKVGLLPDITWVTTPIITVITTVA